MASDLLARLLTPRTWKVRCPDCHGRPTRTEGAWSAKESPRVVWTCPTCEGDGEVDVQLAPEHKEGEEETCETCNGHGYVRIDQPGFEDYGVEPESEPCPDCHSEEGEE